MEELEAAWNLCRAGDKRVLGAEKQPARRRVSRARDRPAAGVAARSELALALPHRLRGERECLASRTHAHLYHFLFSRGPNRLLLIFWASSIMDVPAFLRILSEIEDKFPRLRPANDASRLIC